MYTAYEVAQQLVQIRNYATFSMAGVVELPKDVLSALLWKTAEYRNVPELESLIKMGADPHERHGGFSVLEMFVQGHDGYWCDAKHVKDVEEGVKMLSKYGVTCEDLTHQWILSNCAEIIKNSEYLSTFFKVELVKLYYHPPRAETLTLNPKKFLTVDEVLKDLPNMTTYPQYIAVIEYRGTVTRYLVSKGCGTLEVIPMEDKPGWTQKQEMLSNLVNFVVRNDEFPTLPCEEDDESEFEEE